MPVASRSAFRLDPHWPALLERLAGVLDLDASARTSGALLRRRNVGDSATLLRLALAHGPGGLSLRSAATWAGASGVADLSDVALRRRIRGAASWLGQIAGALLSARMPSEHSSSTARLRIVDGSSVSHAGADGTSWRLHAAYDPSTACFTNLQLTGADGGEGFGRFSFSRGDVAVGDRGYAKPPGLQHVLAAGADFLVRVGWNSMRMITPDGARPDLAAIYAALAPGETTELAVVVTRQSKGQGRNSRRLFPARLIIMRQHEAASERATRAVRQQHRKTRGHMTLQPLTLTSANYLMVLTSLSPGAATAARVMAIYRLRWQIELAFKRLKSGLGLHRLVARDPVMARSWLLSHLILALIIEDATGEVLASPPVRSAGGNRPISLWRLHGALRAALLGTVVQTAFITDLTRAGPAIMRHLCDPPRRRQCQAAAAWGRRADLRGDAAAAVAGLRSVRSWP